MILNEQQLRATQLARDDFRKSLDAFDELKLIQAGIDPVLVRAQRVSIRSAMAELDEQISAYLAKKEVAGGDIQVSALKDIGEQLITARIANGWSQKELAERLGLKEQQVQRYEKERYRMASLERLTDVARVLGVDLSGRLEYRIDAKARSSIYEFLEDIPAAAFPVKEMLKRRWLACSSKLTEVSAKDCLRVFFEDSNLKYVSPALYRRTAKEIELGTRCSLISWQARLKYLAEEKPVGTTYRPLDAETVKHIARLSVHDDGPLQAIEVLAEHGIRVVLLKHLSGTLLDGASMLLDNRQPVIGLTLRLDRLDNFWHVLFHEIGHVTRHWNSGLAEGFLDENEDETSGATDPREQEADEFARNAMIPDEVWKTSFVRYATSATQIIDFAQNAGVAPAVVAGRLRHDRRDYTLWSSLVGRGKVRKLFGDAGLLEE